MARTALALLERPDEQACRLFPRNGFFAPGLPLSIALPVDRHVLHTGIKEPGGFRHALPGSPEADERFLNHVLGIGADGAPIAAPEESAWRCARRARPSIDQRRPPCVGSELR